MISNLVKLNSKYCNIFYLTYIFVYSIQIKIECMKKITQNKISDNISKPLKSMKWFFFEQSK